MKHSVLLVALAITSLPSIGATCDVKIPYPAGKLAEAYSGECKDGLANGRGKFAFSLANNKTNASLLVQVEGRFKDGVLNGFTRTSDSNGGWQVGLFINGREHNATALRVVDGVRVSSLYRNGEQIGLCRSDKDQPRCTPELKAVLDGPARMVKSEGDDVVEEKGSEQPTAAAQSDQGSKGGGWDKWLETTGGQQKPVQKTPAGNTLANGQFTSDQAVEACTGHIRSAWIAPRAREISNVTTLNPINPEEVGLPPMKGRQIYPTTITVVLGNGAKSSINVYIWKDPFGALKCNPS